MISANKIDNIRSAVKQHFGKKFGTLALKRGFATQEQVNKALKEQATEFKASQSYRRTGDILVANKTITKEQCDIIRCEMKNVKSFDGEKEPIKNSTTPSLEPNNKNTGQPGTSIEEMIKLVVSENKREARIRLKKDISGKLTPDEIIGFLNQNNIIFGVKSLEQITDHLSTDANEEKAFLVARGKPATLGCDASIEYHFDTDHLKTGAVNEDGNIDFDGNVVVRGAIIDGFTIKCGNLNAKEIFGAKIFAIGDVHVSGGIIRTQIIAEGNVNAKFIMNSNIKSFGSVLVDKEVIDSKIRSSGNFIETRGTKMFGIYSSIIPKETIRNVFIKENKQTDADKWEMMILESK